MKHLSLRPPDALEYFAALVAEDDGFALLEAAICVAQDDHPRLDPQSVLAEIDRLAGKLRARLPADAPAMQRLRALNHYFFEELAFSGNVNNYYDRRNSYINDVLARRRGIPITLALVYCELAQQLGLTAQGVQVLAENLDGDLRTHAREHVVDAVRDGLTNLQRSRLSRIAHVL